MKRGTFIITKEKFDNMLLSEKGEILERMIEDLEDSETLCIYVNGFSLEELNFDGIEINFDKEIEL